MKHRGNFLVAMAFILPALLIYLFYFIIPIPASIYYSLFQWNGITKTNYKLTPKDAAALTSEQDLPASLVESLKPVLNKKFDSKKEFISAVQTHVSADQMGQYGEKILAYAYNPGMKYLKFGNWEKLFKDPVLRLALRNNIILVIASIILQLPVGLLLGVFISSSMKGTRLFKLVYFIPMMIASVAIGITWNYVYEPNFGMLNGILRAVGLGKYAVGWLGDPRFALAAVIISTCWQFIPFYMVLFAAALTGIPKELYEAACIDGATGVQAFFKITLPLLKNTIRMVCVLSLTGSLRFFDLLYVMTGGGPNHASELLATYMYNKAFTSFEMGYGSTIAVFMFLLSFILAISVLSLRKKGDDETAMA
ncbi:binding-protein-dependent transport systems inner membrane component [Candidatus Moduliflexus flocculans]|uniref:Binding-protein-dependent transport systems inner membrane component n=1 Tax=Candidatus Moduliflexus flocculans TaxID=1499966 RepID=A0A0S6VWY3_9BACT|nr:binding-protein-dependent transport systems inner membrane component [Candidatus Moduliflexus flocculans]